MRRLVATLLVEEASRRARRLGRSRRDFLNAAAGTATAFMVLDTAHGLDGWGHAALLPVRQEHWDDPVGGRELLRASHFVMDVQTHYGPRTRREFLAFLRHELRLLG